ncbi:MAG: mevalonate kinase [Promethearchaeota archaeon]|nr:MAG: mevalonate kinase [Candidatus Lokiarchaeota archaeon]
MVKGLGRPYYLAKFIPIRYKRKHFVVYGLPAIVSALESSTIAEVNVMDGNGWIVDDQRPATPGYKKVKYNDAMQSIKNVLNYLKIDTANHKLQITFSGDLVAASGVGASAAQCTSLARALNNTFNLNLDDEQINNAAYEGEKAYHGTPSGIDNTASTFGGLIWFQKNLNGKKNAINLLKSPIKIPLVIGNTGITASTTEVIADVRKLKNENPKKINKIFNNYEDLVQKAKDALLRGKIKEIGSLMNLNHKLLQQINVSGDINDQLVQTALNNGATGAKMTGTGRGGLIIALADNVKVQDQIYNSIVNEGFTAWKTKIG